MNIYKLPPLPFAYDSLEPLIDEETMYVHHDGHHRSYVDKLNETMSQRPDLARPIEELLARLNTLPSEIRTSVLHNGGGHANHSLFWTILSPLSKGKPSDDLMSTIEGSFGTFSSFKDRFTDVATDHFSNGWTWLTANSHGTLRIYSTKDHESPISSGETPLLVLDLWEHAYYLKHQNHRNEYITNFWNVVNWAEVEARWDEYKATGSTAREWRIAG